MQTGHCQIVIAVATATFVVAEGGKQHMLVWSNAVQGLLVL